MCRHISSRIGTSPPGTLNPAPGLIFLGKNTEAGSTPGNTLDHVNM